MPLALATCALAACAGPPMTTPIEGEPVCPDFQLGAAHTKMTGSLRFPVVLFIKSGSTVVFKTTIVGRRTDAESGTRVLLSDDNETYHLEWAQCQNERAPTPLDIAGREVKADAKYECGESTVYKKEDLTTKKGDPKSHVITFQPPPQTACLQSVAPTELADAGAPDAAADASAESAGTDAGADMDAGAAAADAGDPDAGATDAGPTDAGATDAGSTDAGATDAGAGAKDAGASTSK